MRSKAASQTLLFCSLLETFLFLPPAGGTSSGNFSQSNQLAVRFIIVSSGRPFVWSC